MSDAERLKWACDAADGFETGMQSALAGVQAANNQMRIMQAELAQANKDVNDVNAENLALRTALDAARAKLNALSQ